MSSSRTHAYPLISSLYGSVYINPHDFLGYKARNVWTVCAIVRKAVRYILPILQGGSLLLTSSNCPT